MDGRISILFGRENWGLNNEEVKRSDMICTIPTSAEYPILNLSHAVGVVCYELSNLPLPGMRWLHRTIWGTCTATSTGTWMPFSHPAFKRENTMVLIRRVLGRANLTIREASTLHGLLRRSEWHIDPALLDRDQKVPPYEDENEE